MQTPAAGSSSSVNLAGAALALRVGDSISGTLDRRADVDCYRFEGEAGRYAMAIRGAAGAPIKWSVGDAQGSEREATVALAPGSIACLERGDPDAPRDQMLPGSAASYRLELRVAPRH